MVDKKKIFKDIPSVSSIIESAGGDALCNKYGSGITKHLIRTILDEIRSGILNDHISSVPGVSQLTADIEKELIRIVSSEGKKAVNATGILLHTGLGRAPLCQEAINKLNIFDSYSVLQTDLQTGKRSLREVRIEKMICELTGCEAVTLANNNAAATMLVLNTLSAGKEAIISRGQLIEIGGAFRIPDVMKLSNAVLREIGTTNRTHLKDYKNAIGEDTGAIIHVHTSNYRVRGFAGTPDIKKICEIRDKEFPELPVIDDLGSGALVPLSEWGLTDEPLIKDSISSGTDVACFSGDKLICGPQVGIICGKKDIIARIRENPYARMFRVCKMTLSVLEATLVHFLNEDFRTALPFYIQLEKSMDQLHTAAKDIIAKVKISDHITLSTIEDYSYIGSGSIPDEGVPSVCIKISLTEKAPYSIEKLSRNMRMNTPSIFGRKKDDSLLLDMRTLLPGDSEHIIEALKKIN